MDIKQGIINKRNKIRYIVTNTKCGDEVIALIRVNVGSRDEKDSIKGMSHILEHMFFRGTEKFPTQKDLTGVLYRCGGKFNAYTSKDSTVFYISVSKKCIEQGLDVLSDAFYNSLFRTEDLEKEKKIVINEINDYLSDPSTLMEYGLSELLYKSTRLEKDIAGSVKTVKSIDIDMMKTFINTYYNDNVIVSVSGNIECEKIVQLIKRFFVNKVDYYVENTKNNNEIKKDKQKIYYNNLHLKQKKFRMKFIKKTEEQSFIGLGFVSYKNNDKKNYQLIIISEILTGYLGAELYKTLRGDHGLVYGVYSGLDTYIDTGDFSVTCSTENNTEKILKCIVIILNEIKKIKQGEIDDKLFEDTKKNKINEIKKLKYEPSDLAERFADDLIYSKKIVKLNKLEKNIKSVTIESIIKVANELFLPEKLCISYTAKERVELG
tara:strand:+ start:1268 stop:2569 length:1302 start_codon:yes stop_codon:yes gene_type:complete